RRREPGLPAHPAARAGEPRRDPAEIRRHPPGAGDSAAGPRPAGVQRVPPSPTADPALRPPVLRPAPRAHRLREPAVTPFHTPGAAVSQRQEVGTMPPDTRPESGFLVLADICGFTRFGTGTEVERGAEGTGGLLAAGRGGLARPLEIQEMDGDSVLALGPDRAARWAAGRI